MSLLTSQPPRSKSFGMPPPRSQPPTSMPSSMPPPGSQSPTFVPFSMPPPTSQPSIMRATYLLLCLLACLFLQASHLSCLLLRASLLHMARKNPSIVWLWEILEWPKWLGV
ncbi:hypothetical protein ACH5RR_025738 [Cinchona calisaya]|uniref:Uncharacterized protein n=1 Tax=Cinchona calisaya TaxID=153742 RepID=A0ABD2Z0I5_9GENT